jgi:hypothetical protein
MVAVQQQPRCTSIRLGVVAENRWLKAEGLLIDDLLHILQVCGRLETELLGFTSAVKRLRPQGLNTHIPATFPSL